MRKDILKQYIPEFIFLFFLYLSILMKLLYLPFANIMYVFSTITLAGIYMLFGVILFSDLTVKNLFGLKKDKEKTTIIFYSIFAGLSISVYTTYYWLWVLHIPLMKIYLIASAIMFIFVSLIALALSIKKLTFLKLYMRFVLSVLLVSIPHIVLHYFRPAWNFF